MLMVRLFLDQRHNQSRRQCEHSANERHEQCPPAAIPFLILSEMIVQLLLESSILLFQFGNPILEPVYLGQHTRHIRGSRAVAFEESANLQRQISDLLGGRLGHRYASAVSRSDSCTRASICGSSVPSRS